MVSEMADLTTNFIGNFWHLLFTKSSFCLGKTYAKIIIFHIYSNFEMSLLTPKMGYDLKALANHCLMSYNDDTASTKLTCDKAFSYARRKKSERKRDKNVNVTWNCRFHITSKTECERMSLFKYFKIQCM